MTSSHPRTLSRSCGKLTAALGIVFIALILLLGVTRFIANLPDFSDDQNQIGSAHFLAPAQQSSAGGDFVWARAMGDIDTGEGMSLALDSFRNVYFAGHFQGTIDFDPGLGTFNLTSAGITDIFVTKLSGPPGLTFTPASGNLSLVEGASDVYQVQLNTQPTASVTLTLTVDDQVGVTPAQLVVIPLSWSQPQTVTVSAVRDNIIEGQHTGTVTHVLNSADPAYNALAPLSFTINLDDATSTGIYMPFVLK
jgi:hypothetical protein